ncbi:relaxase/mobilization nuclease domain-containing protein [Escherichia coli]|nr:relaxase/mobilization nuclease domain-containing protein [Escherichia coli]
MIAKRAERRKDGKSSFSKLASYITRESNEEAIAFSSVSNCGFDDIDLAVKEIEATQKRNTRSKADKTYHLVVSFPAGEIPDKEQLKDIEDEICKSIGLGDHQRISAAHNDTDNFHLHIAINKIHPVSHRAIEPYYDKYRLDEACSRLELKHGLQRDNRIDKTNSKERDSRETGRAGDMEAHSGLDSFKRWIKDRKEPLQKALEKADSWDELHKAFAEHDLEIRPRGAGFVVSARNQKAFTKASDLGREFSKGQLESKFGPYQVPAEQIRQQEPVESYRKPPQHGGAERSELWEKFQREKHETIAVKKQLLQAVKEQRQAELDRQRKDYAARKDAIKKDTLLKPKQKREVYKTLAKNHKARSAAAFQAYRHEVDKIHNVHQVKGWQEWLVDRATEGNTAALTMLRSAARRPQKGAERFAFMGNDQGQVFTPLEPTVQANGDVLYTVGGARIRDTGERLRLDADQGGDVAAAIRLAREKYGDHLSVDGDEKFKQAVVEAAVATGQAVTFADPAMEQRRQVLQELVNAKTEGEKEREQEKGRADEVQGWINKRNETRLKTYDIMEHRKFTESDAGPAIYKGSRKVSEGVTVGLYEKSGTMLVLPVTERQAERFRRLPVGTPVKLNKRGHVQFQKQERGHGR